MEGGKEMKKIIEILEEELPHQVKLPLNGNAWKIHLLHIASRLKEAK